MELESEWRILPLDHRIIPSYHLGAIPFLGQILVFGGVFITSRRMYVLTEEGEVLKDLSKDPLIPQHMCSKPYIAKEGRIYTIIVGGG